MEEAKDSITSLCLSDHEILTGYVPDLITLISSLSSSSVDTKVRRYDLRFGKLYADTVGREFY